MNEAQKKENDLFDTMQGFRRDIHKLGVDNKHLLERLRTLSSNHQQEKDNMRQQMENVKNEVNVKKLEVAKKMQEVENMFNGALRVYEDMEYRAIRDAKKVWGNLEDIVEKEMIKLEGAKAKKKGRSLQDNVFTRVMSMDNANRFVRSAKEKLGWK